jgi:predicted nucleic acid-binding protein
VANIKVYLDNCCYNRPFDDQTQLRIALETQAKLYVQLLIVNHKINLVWSYVSALENQKNPDENRRTSITEFARYAGQIIIKNDIILKTAREITNAGLKPVDALHVSCAIAGRVDFFITTDDRILKYQAVNAGLTDTEFR